MLGWKSIFSSTIFENKSIMANKSSKKWLPLDSLDKLATQFVNQKLHTNFLRSDKVELKLSKGSIIFFYKNITAQIDGTSGSVILIEKKYGSLIQDIHDGAIMDELTNNKSGISKKIYSTVIGFTLLMLTITGFYLWYKPNTIKRKK